MKRVFDLIERGVFTTRLVTMILTGTMVYLWVTQMNVPETLRTAWLIIMGFWFKGEYDKAGGKE